MEWEYPEGNGDEKRDPGIQEEAREGWWSRGLLDEADHFPVGKASGPKARGQILRRQAEAREGWWSRGLLGEADHFPVGKARGPMARGQTAARRREGQTAEKTEVAKTGQRPVGKTGGHKKTPTFLRVFRVRTGRFELPTSCLSSMRSKPTELSPRRLGLQR